MRSSQSGSEILDPISLNGTISHFVENELLLYEDAIMCNRGDYANGVSTHSSKCIRLTDGIALSSRRVIVNRTVRLSAESVASSPNNRRRICQARRSSSAFSLHVITINRLTAVQNLSNLDCAEMDTERRLFGFHRAANRRKAMFTQT